jgi:hypothetical protein
MTVEGHRDKLPGGSRGNHVGQFTVREFCNLNFPVTIGFAQLIENAFARRTRRLGLGRIGSGAY